VAGHVGLELANVILKKPLKCWANSHGLRNILGPETFRVRAAADQVPEPVGEVAVSTLGDTWQLGRHRLLCGNALELRAIATKGPGKNETPKSGLRDQGPEWHFCSPIRDIETARYLRNAPVARGFEGLSHVDRWRLDWLAGVGGLEPANVILKKPLRCRANSRWITRHLGARDFSRASCSPTDMQLVHTDHDVSMITISNCPVLAPEPHVSEKSLVPKMFRKPKGFARHFQIAFLKRHLRVRVLHAQAG
jgi:hypothetical protein